MKENGRIKKRKKRAGLRIFLGIMLVGVIGLLGYGYSVYRNVNDAVETIHKPVETEVVREESVDLNKQHPISILLLGIDSGDLGRTEQGRSDSIVVATINPNTKKMLLLSIPRDTYAEIVGNGTSDKINHAYAFGGTAMSINTVQKLLDIPIDYYITVNMAGIQEIVDVVGGIEVDSPLAFTAIGYTFQEGVNHLDGAAALAFARMRYEDPLGDTGRQARQRLIIEGVIQKLVSPNTLLNYQDILASLSENIETNLQMSDYFDLQGNDYVAAASNIQQEQLAGIGSTEADGVYYSFTDAAELARVQALLRAELELE